MVYNDPERPDEWRRKTLHGVKPLLRKVTTALYYGYTTLVTEPSAYRTAQPRAPGSTKQNSNESASTLHILLLNPSIPMHFPSLISDDPMLVEIGSSSEELSTACPDSMVLLITQMVYQLRDRSQTNAAVNTGQIRSHLFGGRMKRS